MNGVERLAAGQDFIGCVGRGDFPGALAHLHAGVRVHEPSALPYGGLHVGHDAFQALFRDGVGATWSRWKERENRWAVVGDLVLRETVVQARSRATGRDVEFALVETMEFSGPLIGEVRPFYFDQQVVVRAITGRPEA